jgi:hypothetical protein
MKVVMPLEEFLERFTDISGMHIILTLPSYKKTNLSYLMANMEYQFASGRIRQACVCHN